MIFLHFCVRKPLVYTGVLLEEKKIYICHFKYIIFNDTRNTQIREINYRPYSEFLVPEYRHGISKYYNISFEIRIVNGGEFTDGTGPATGGRSGQYNIRAHKLIAFPVIIRQYWQY